MDKFTARLIELPPYEIWAESALAALVGQAVSPADGYVITRAWMEGRWIMVEAENHG